MLTEIVLVFVLGVSVAIIFWCLMGVLMLPVFGENMLTLCCVDGEGDRLEQQIRAYGWLRDGRITGGRFVIVDHGLTARGLELAMQLREHYDWVDYCPGQALTDYLELTDCLKGYLE